MNSLDNVPVTMRPVASRRLPRLLAVLMAIALAIPIGGCGGGQTRPPGTFTEFSAIKRRAESCLNDSGKALARGKTDGASIYWVSASLDTAGKSLEGEERVLFTNRTQDNLSEVVFRVYASDAGSGESRKPTIIKGARANGRGAEARLDGSVLSVSVPGGIAPGRRAVVSFSFSEPIPPAGQDVTDGLFAYDSGTFDLGGFLPTVVTYSGGTWDTRAIPRAGDANYYDCSYYSVSFKAPSEYVVAATGVELENNSGTHVFTAGPVRDFEVQASDRYRVATRKVGSTEVASYYFGTDSKAGTRALDSGCRALSLFSQHFGPYPYTRLNICEAPMEADGMEFTGQVQAASFLYEDADLAQDLTATVAHEVCHQWWAIGVGSDSIGLPWLDESLTSYCEPLYYLWSEGEASGQEALAVLADNYWSARREGVPDGPVDQAVSAFASEDQYTALVYGKGALFFNELQKSLGPPGFEKSLSEYYRKHVFLNASTQDLLSPFRANSGGSTQVDELYRRWIAETHGDEDVPR
ncbi:MAG: M1 family metallopeptidase [Candidatus Geothermincolia bacterium]